MVDQLTLLRDQQTHQAVLHPSEEGAEAHSQAVEAAHQEAALAVDPDKTLYSKNRICKSEFDLRVYFYYYTEEKMKTLTFCLK